MEEKVQRPEIGQLIALDVARHQMAEVPLDALRGNFPRESWIVALVIRDHADVARVALITGARMRDAGKWNLQAKVILARWLSRAPAAPDCSIEQKTARATCLIKEAGIIFLGSDDGTFANGR